MFALYLIAVYFIVRWLGPEKPAEWFLGLVFVGVIIPAATFLLAIALHALGDGACNLLADFGFDPRPKQRYRR